MKKFTLLRRLPNKVTAYWVYGLYDNNKLSLFYSDSIENLEYPLSYNLCTLEDLQNNYQIIAEIDSLEELKDNYPELFI